MSMRYFSLGLWKIGWPFIATESLVERNFQTTLMVVWVAIADPTLEFGFEDVPNLSTNEAIDVPGPQPGTGYLGDKHDLDIQTEFVVLSISGAANLGSPTAYSSADSV